jgi:hypothetical protein
VKQSIDVFTAEVFPLSLVVLVDDDLKSNDAAQMAPSLRAMQRESVRAMKLLSAGLI